MSQEPDDLEDSAGAGCEDSQGSSQPGPGESQDESQVPGNLQQSFLHLRRGACDLEDSAGAGCGDSQGSSQPVPGGSQDESQVSGTSL